MNRTFLVFCLFAGSVLPCAAQEAPPLAASNASASARAPQTAASARKGRPRIGVALEGGGALGLAHIGVLQWFEEHHIPVDYIAGTSMGSLVGGLYATGQSPAEMQKLVTSLDWPFIIGGWTPYQDLSYRRKEDARAYPNGIAFGFKNGFDLPSGLNAGQQISLIIDHQTLAYSDVKSFDDLPIPFRCVSTELVSGKRHVFTKGPVGEAMRSSMSLPGVFSPVRVGNDLYVDGALVDNLPSDVVRDMGPDIVIAVHLQVSAVTADEIQSAFSVLGRSVTVGIASTELRGMAAADIVVKVDVEQFSALDYGKAAPLIQKGVEAAQNKAMVLAPYQLDDAAWAEYLAKRDARKRAAASVPQFVKVRGGTPEANVKIEKFLKPLVGKPINKEEMDTYLTRLTGFGIYNSTSYVLSQEDGQVGLIVTVHEKNYAPPLGQLGIEVDGSQPDNVVFTLDGRVTFMDIAGYRSEWRTDFQVGNTYGVASELYKRFNDHTKFFFSPYIEASNAGAKIYSYNDPTAVYRIESAQFGLDVGYSFSRFTELRAGYEVGYKKDRLQLGTPEFASVSGRDGAARLRLVSDHTDDPVIPRQGFLGSLDFHWYDTSPAAPNPFPVLAARTEFFVRTSDPGSLFLRAEGGSTFNYQQTGIPQFFLGGTQGLLAYGLNEFRGDQYYFVRAGYLHRLFYLPPFVGKGVYAAAIVETAKMYMPTQTQVSKQPTDGAAGIIMQTAIGPIFVGGSVGDTGHAKWFFSIGRVF